MVPRRRILTASSLVGTVGIAGCQFRYFHDESDPDEASTLEEEAELNEISVSYIGATPPNVNAGEPGWILVSPEGEESSVTFDLRVCGDVEDITAIETFDGYTLQVTADLEADESECRVSRILGSVSLPMESVSLPITVNDEQIEEIEHEGPTALYELPDLLTTDVVSE